MKELTIHHFASAADSSAGIRVSYRPQEGAQAQERKTDFGFEVTEEQRRLIQWYLEEYLIYPWGELRERAKGVEVLMRQLGEQLFDAVLRSKETAALYAHVADDLANTRIVIHASDPEGIALPWELLRDSTRGEYGDLARLAHAFVRSQPDLIFQPAPPPADEKTFNILMVICRPGGPESDVPFQSVARPLLELFRPHRDRIRLEILRPPTFEQLSRVLNDKPNFYHVLHFDGHGAFPGAGTNGLLLFEGENDEPRRVTGAELGGLLAGKNVPVVLLNACQSGMTHPEAIYQSVGNELLKAGTRGVVAMAYSVYVQSAVRFMARLYESLIKGDELARAVALGREDLRAHPQRLSPIGEVPLQDWMVPVLFEAASVRAVTASLAELRLNPIVLQDQQATAGAEIDCPEPPAFGFVGRDGVMLDLERAFRKEEIVLLEGMAGVGKTEMAAGFARWRAETGGLDGPIFFFRFEHYLPLAQVCDRVGQVFGAAIKQQLQVESQLLDSAQRRQIAVSVLKQVPCMLIWDNFEPVHGFPTGATSDWSVDEQQELREFLRDLRGGKTKVLLTSRRNESWLGNIYRRVELGGLRLAEAQELAVRVLERAGLKPQQIKSLPQYNDLLKYLRGNPIAIQVILPELKRAKPDDLLRSLQIGEIELSGDDPAQGRERSLSASLTYRLDALDVTLRQRLALLALFRGFVDADVLGVLCQVDGVPPVIKDLRRTDWISILDKATELGLIRRLDEGYYAVHPALAWFFHELLGEQFSDHLDWLESAFSTAYGEYGRYLRILFQRDAQMAMILLQAEEDNLMLALHIAQRRRLWKDVENVLYGLNHLLITQGRWVEWERLVGKMEAEVSGADGDPLPGTEELWKVLLGHRSQIALYRRDFETSRVIYLRLKNYFEVIGDERNEAVTLHQLGRIAQERRQFDEAEEWYRGCLQIAERIGDENSQASTLHQLGRLAQERRQLAEAEQLYLKSLAIEKRIGDESVQASTLHQLGRLAQDRRELDTAEHWYRESLEIEERIGNEQGKAGTLHQFGAIAQLRGNLDDAERWYRKSLVIEERIGYEHGQAITLLELGTIAQKRRNFEEAERWYRQSLAISERIEDDHGKAITFHQLGITAQERGNLDEAERWYRQSLALKERIQNDHGRATTLHQLGKIAEEQGRKIEARQFYEEAEVIFDRLDDPHSLNIVLSSLKRVQA